MFGSMLEATQIAVPLLQQGIDVAATLACRDFTAQLVLTAASLKRALPIAGP
jgi:hypothetical protein